MNKLNIKNKIIEDLMYQLILTVADQMFKGTLEHKDSLELKQVLLEYSEICSGYAYNTKETIALLKAFNIDKEIKRNWRVN